jgi:hypothetical protein
MKFGINFFILGGLILLVMLGVYMYSTNAIKNQGELSMNGKDNSITDNDKLMNELFNDSAVQPGLDEYAQYGGKAPEKQSENTVEYKGKKFTAADASDQSLFKVQDYLPQDKINGWFDVPESTVTLTDVNLIDNRDFIGVNTVGSSLRNASLDLRSAPPCPRVLVSPWNQSTIEPDVNLKSICN